MEKTYENEWIAFMKYAVVFILGMGLTIFMSSGMGNEIVKTRVLNDICKDLTQSPYGVWVDKNRGPEVSFNCELQLPEMVVPEKTVNYPKPQ